MINTENTPFQVVVEKIDAEYNTQYKIWYNVRQNENGTYSLVDTQSGYVVYTIKSIEPQYLGDSDYLIQIFYHGYETTHEYIKK